MTLSIPKRQDDPLGYAKWWLGPELVRIALHLQTQLEALFLAEAAQPAVPKDSA